MDFKKITGRRIIGATIVIAWIIILGTMVARQRVLKGGPLSGEIPPDLLGDHWYVMRLKGEKIGWMVENLEKVEGGFKSTGESRMEFTALGTKQEAHISAKVDMDEDLALKAFSLDFTSSAQNLHIEGEMEGMTLNIRIHSPADAPAEKQSIKLDEPVYISGTVPLNILQKGLKVGDRFEVASFAPQFIMADTTIMEVEKIEEIEAFGETVSAYVLRVDFRGLTMRSWVDDRGRNLRMEGPMGISTELVTKKEALRKEKQGKIDLVAEAAIPTNRFLEDSHKIRYIKVKLTGVENMYSEYLDGGVQKVLSDHESEELTIVINIPEPGEGFNLADGEIAAHMEQWVRPEPLVQSDDPEIVQGAREIADGSTNSAQVAKNINQWLFENMIQQGTFTLPSAREVWRDRRGDCNEHTVLYTALARASGLPTRMAAGVVYLDGAFYYHAWPEVWFGREQGWIPVDPTFREYPADATHIRLAIGSLQNQYAIIKFMGKLKIEILDYSYSRKSDE